MLSLSHFFKIWAIYGIYYGSINQIIPKIGLAQFFSTQVNIWMLVFSRLSSALPINMHGNNNLSQIKDHGPIIRYKMCLIQQKMGWEYTLYALIWVQKSLIRSGQSVSKSGYHLPFQGPSFKTSKVREPLHYYCNPRLILVISYKVQNEKLPSYGGIGPSLYPFLVPLFS